MNLTYKLAVLSLSAILTTAGCTSATEQRKTSNQPPQATAVNTQPPLPENMISYEVAKRERASVRQDKAEAAMDSTVFSFAPGQTRHPVIIHQPHATVDRENYHPFDDNPVKRVSEHPVSTFSIDVDTGAYANIRRIINNGQLPREDAVRVEELINYFDYDYPLPENNDAFSVTTELSTAPWNPHARLLHIGIKGRDVHPEQIPAANLVFLVDVSGSMQSADKLGLLKKSLKLLSRQMRATDKISLVVYAGSSGVVLQPTSGREKFKINNALDRLTAGGSTNGASGIRLAYDLAQQHFIQGGINRIILATDGDFNVGTVNFEALKDLVEEKRKSGVSLTTLGFGTGNYNDHLMEQLADSGNGNYAYIDTLNEAQKVLVDEMSSTLQTIARDVKIQIEFNPAQVKEYRLIGYENRQLKREDFNNDRVDAGDIGAGHTVTALYELVLQQSPGHRIDPLRYATKTRPSLSTHLSDELAFLRLRYKKPHGNDSLLLENPIRPGQNTQDISRASGRHRFAAAVAGFGQLLRGGRYIGRFGYDDILVLARNARGKDPFGYRGEFIKLVNLARSLATPEQTARLE